MNKVMDFRNEPTPAGPPQMGEVVSSLPPAPVSAPIPPPAFEPADERRGSNLTRYVIAIGLLVVIVGAAGFALFAAARGPIDAANEFLAAESVGDIDTLLKLTSADPECWGSDVESRLQSVVTKIDFKSYNLTNTSVNKTSAGTTGRVDGTVDIGYETNINILMVSDSGTWKVCGFAIE
jgi:hypothetical protein